MKKLIFIPLLILSILCNAQFTKGGGTFLKTTNSFITTPSIPVDYDDDVDTYISGLSTQLGSTFLGYLDTFVTDLKADMGITNLSDAFDIMYVFANETEEAGKRNLVGRSYDCTNQHSTTWTQYRGFTGNGSTDYLTTGYTPNTHKVRLSQNSASFGYYARVAATPSGNRECMGCGQASPDSYFAMVETPGVYIYLNDATNLVFTPNPDATSAGMFILCRPNSTNINYYRNKSVRLSSDATTSVAVPNVELVILAGNSSGTIENFSANELSFAFVGRNLTADEVGYVTDRFEIFMDSLGYGIIP
jgi:hypothetical protein